MIEEGPKPPDARERRALVDVLARAFRDNPMNVEIHGADARHRVRANRAGLKALALDMTALTEMRVIALEGKVIGGWIAAPPDVRVFPAPSAWRQIGCLWHQGARAMDRWGEVSGQLQERRPLLPHWYLAVLGVDPDHQGQGWGGRLLSVLVERAGRERAPIYLECDREESVRFYLRRGFRVREDLEIHGVRCRGLGLGFADDT